MPAFANTELAAWTGGRWTHAPAAVVRGFSQDTRQLGGGQAFVALRTEKRDGHDFLADAAAAGAAAAMVSREIPGVDLPQLLVADPQQALQAIAREHRRRFPGSVIGVTGSAGKTSTKDLLALLLGGAPEILATEGNLNNHIGVPLTLTRIDPAAHHAAVVEAGISARGEMRPLGEMIAPDHSIVTLVAAAHLEKLGTLDEVAVEKAVLPACNRPGGLAVFPWTCWRHGPFRALAHPLVLVPAGENISVPGGRTVLFQMEHDGERTTVTLGEGRKFSLRRVSDGMAQNAALALALAAELGVADAVLQGRLAAWRPARWRGEWRREKGRTLYLDCYNANPASMGDALRAFADMVPAEWPRLYVIGCMEELGAEAGRHHHELGRAIRLRPQDRLFVVGAHAADVQRGALEAGVAPGQIELAADAGAFAEPVRTFQGAVLVKGSRRYELEKLFQPTAANATAHA